MWKVTIFFYFYQIVYLECKMYLNVNSDEFFQNTWHFILQTALSSSKLSVFGQESK